mgnify:FL=1
MKKRDCGLFKFNDIVIIATICIIAVCLLFSENANQAKAVAVISVDGEEVQRVDLTDCDNTTLTLKTTPVVTLEIIDGKIRFINSDCPDKTCEKSGFLSKVGDTAACVPAKTVVTVEGNEVTADLDAVAG